MMKITDIDPNFKDSPIANCNLEYHCMSESAKFGLTGVFFDPKKQSYARVNRETLDAINDEGVEYLAHCTAGGEVRFTTDSPVLVLKAKLLHEGVMSHMPRTGSSGFDIFCDGKFTKNLKPETPTDFMVTGMGFTDETNEKKSRDFSIVLPLYNGVISVEIGVLEGCEITPINTPRKRVLFYGSSITQGGCASKPGNSYPAMIARWQNLEQINLGFSGNAKGREEMARYIASFHLDVFVMDYDHNAPNPQHLSATHEKMFEIFRQANPKTPVILVSAPDERGDRIARRDIIKKTYNNAVKNGDENVYFIDGETLFEGIDRDACTMDGCHPNDLGFFRMASLIGKKIEKILSK